MTENIIGLILTNFPLIMLILSILYGVIIPGKIAARLFGIMLFLCVGISGIWGFVMHCFFSQLASGNIGWAKSPFEFEVSLANLALGVTGVIAAFANWSFRFAVVLFTTVFLWGAAGGHIYQAILTNDFNPGNTGSILWTDILIPLILLVLLPFNYKKSDQGVIYY